MSRGPSRLTVASVALAGFLLAGCAPVADDSAPETASPRPDPTPTPSPTLVVPEPVAGEIARAVHTPDGGEDDSPVTSSIASDIIRTDEPFVVRGQCVGDRFSYELVEADPGGERNTLTAGTIVCGPAETRNSGISTPYEGPAQLTITSTDGVERAWVVVEPAGP